VIGAQKEAVSLKIGSAAAVWRPHCTVADQTLSACMLLCGHMRRWVGVLGDFGQGRLLLAMRGCGVKAYSCYAGNK